MQQIETYLIEGAADTWREACNRLMVRVTAPFDLASGASSVKCIAFLPDFGGPNGMVILSMDLPEVKPDQNLASLAKRDGLYFSFLNVSVFANKAVPDEVFKEVLEDWGYFGPLDRRPKWYAG